VGKSSLALALVRAFEDRGRKVGLVAMDGFHLDNKVLEAKGLRAVKGAPDSFDLGGFTSLLQRLTAGETVFAPEFDRARDIAVAGCAEISEDVEIVLVEGNYLLFDAPGWRDLRRFWTVSIFLAAQEEVLVTRLLQRWRDHGFDEEVARAKALGNDIPNAKRVLRRRISGIDVVVDL